MDDIAGVEGGNLGLLVQVVDHDAAGKGNVREVDLGPDVQPGGGPDVPWPVQGHHDQHGDQSLIQEIHHEYGQAHEPCS